MDMLCLMFECERRGVLASCGEAWSDRDIAASISGDTSANVACIQELLRKGVAGRDATGAIHSRRMIRDEELRQATKERVQVHRTKRNSDVTQVVTQVKRLCTEDEREDIKEVEVAFDLEDFDHEKAVRAIQAAHPRPENSHANEIAILEAIEHVVKQRNCKRQEASEWLLSRTEMYRLATEQWPEKQFITKSTRWFTARGFEEDPQFWERKKGNGEDFRAKIDRAVRQMADQDSGAD